MFLNSEQGVSGRRFVCKHGSHVTGIPKADWPGMKSKQLTATPCSVLAAVGKREGLWCKQRQATRLLRTNLSK